MDSVFTNLSRFVPMQDALSTSQFDAARTNLNAAGAQAKQSQNALYDERLKKTCTEFEAIFIKQMLDAMRQTVDHSGSLVKQGMANNIFQDMLYDEYSRKMAKAGHFGIAEMMYKQFTEKVIQPNA